MSYDFEQHMMNGIPPEEASNFFIRVRGFKKTAAQHAEELEAAFNELPSDEQDTILKTAQEEGWIEKVHPDTAHVHSERMLAALHSLPGNVFQTKLANGVPVPGQPEAPAMGKVMQPPNPVNLPATATGVQAGKVASAEKKDPEETGKERARASISAEFEKEKAHKHETNNEFAGRLAGALVGGGAAHRYGKGNIGGTLGGIALGQHMGGKWGKFLGGKQDAHAHEKKAVAEFATSPANQPEMGGGGPVAASGNVPGPAAGAPDMSEYLSQERAGQAAEEQASAAFYQQRFQEAQAQLQQAQQQAEQMGQQVQQLEQTVAGSDQQIQAAMQQAQMASQSAMSNVQQAHEMAMTATQQAMESQSEVLRQKQLAAAMRMGAQQMKDGVMSALAQDPTDALAQQLTSPPPGSGGMVGGPAQQQPGAVDPATGQPVAGDPSMAAASQQAGQGGAPVEGAAGQAADPGGAPSSAPPGGEGGGSKEKSKDKSSGEGSESSSKGTTKVEVKHAAAAMSAIHEVLGQLSPMGALAGAAAGGAVGGGVAALAPRGNAKLEAQIAEQEANPQKGFGRALDIAQAKARLALGQVAQNHPMATAGLGATLGAVTGAVNGRQMAADAGGIGRDVKDIFGQLRGGAV